MKVLKKIVMGLAILHIANGFKLYLKAGFVYGLQEIEKVGKKQTSEKFSTFFKHFSIFRSTDAEKMIT